MNHKPSLVEAFLTHLLNFLYTLHSLQSRSHKITIIFNGTVASLFEFESRVLCKMNKEEEKTYNTNILSVSSTESLGPANLTGIALQIEVLSAFRTAEAEYLEI